MSRTAYVVEDGPKMLRETLCVAQGMVARSADSRAAEHVARLQRLIDECDRHRPLGRNGKHGHGQRCTASCGCEDREAAVVDDTPRDARGEPYDSDQARYRDEE